MLGIVRSVVRGMMFWLLGVRWVVDCRRERGGLAFAYFNRFLSSSSVFLLYDTISLFPLNDLYLSLFPTSSCPFPFSPFVCFPLSF